jgi:hypothetical protein
MSIVSAIVSFYSTGRVYYEKRSQPPLLIPMAYEYYKKLKTNGNEKNANQFMEKIIGSLEKVIICLKLIYFNFNLINFPFY